jgi:hypothetical protein
MYKKHDPIGVLPPYLSENNTDILTCNYDKDSNTYKCVFYFFLAVITSVPPSYVTKSLAKKVSIVSVLYLALVSVLCHVAGTQLTLVQQHNRLFHD